MKESETVSKLTDSVSGTREKEIRERAEDEMSSQVVEDLGRV